jgi:hypothetical protein
LITVTTRRRGPYTEDWLRRMALKTYLQLDKYGPIGVAALKRATPEDEGQTANSWYYQIVRKRGFYCIQWCNRNVEEPGTIPVAILIQYGHGTRTGGYVEGTDFINPAMRPIFEKMAADMWKEVTR